METHFITLTPNIDPIYAKYIACLDRFVKHQEAQIMRHDLPDLEDGEVDTLGYKLSALSDAFQYINVVLQVLDSPERLEAFRVFMHQATQRMAAADTEWDRLMTIHEDTFNEPDDEEVG